MESGSKPTMDLSLLMDEDGRPLRCPGCTSESITEHSEDHINGIVIQKYLECGFCGEFLTEWFAGSYNRAATLASIEKFRGKLQ